MTSASQPAGLEPSSRDQRRVSVAAILAVSFGALIFITVAAVLAVSVGANYRNTVDLLGTQASLLVDAMEDSLRSYMSEPENAVAGIATIYREGGFEIDDAERMNAALEGALSVVPQATAMFILTEDMVERGAVRQPAAGGKPTSIEIIKPKPIEEPDVRQALAKRIHQEGRQWGSFVANQYGLFTYVSMPLERDGLRRGYAVMPVELKRLSHFTQELSRRFGTHAFILNGEDEILAHERLVDPPLGQKEAKPLLPLGQIGDPVLARFNQRQPVNDEAPLPRVEISEIQLDNPADIDGEQSYIALTRKIAGYGDQPWIIGGYFERQDLDAELERAAISGLIGLAALVISVIAAIILGRWLSRPVEAIADQAQRVASFDLDDVTPLPRSRIKELDDQASAFNAMLVGLRAFSTYIPRSLVAKLVRSGEDGIAAPREATVTVMFTDIAQFTTLSEHMNAADTTRYLNHHFEILCRAVDANGGTVDKFLGDGMMAFFGAPDHLERHAAAAARAAAQIREDMAADAREAQKQGRPVFQLRIGLHSGPVTVGNIGGSDRVNYTIIGDTVNVSQRLQGLGKQLAPDAETAIIVSAETASELDSRFEIIPAGLHSLRGRGEAMEVYMIGKVDLEATTPPPEQVSSPIVVPVRKVAAPIAKVSARARGSAKA